MFGWLLSDKSSAVFLCNQYLTCETKDSTLNYKKKKKDTTIITKWCLPLLSLVFCCLFMAKFLFQILSAATSMGQRVTLIKHVLCTLHIRQICFLVPTWQKCSTLPLFVWKVFFNVFLFLGVEILSKLALWAPSEKVRRQLLNYTGKKVGEQEKKGY